MWPSGWRCWARGAEVNVMRRLVFTQRARRARRVGQRDIAVGPNQVDGVARQPRRLVLRAPSEHVEGNVARRAPLRQFGRGLASSSHFGNRAVFAKNPLCFGSGSDSTIPWAFSMI